MTVQQGTVLKAVSTEDLPGTVKAQNVWYWKLVGVNPISDTAAMDAIVDAIEAFFTDLATRTQENITLDDVIVHEWEFDAVEGWQTGRFIGVRELSVVFTNVLQMLPHAVAAVITAFTQDVKRRSRKSIAGLTEDTQDSSAWSGDTVTALAAAAVEWLANRVILGSDQLEPGLAGYDGLWYPLVSALVSSITGSQRQRKPGIGI